MTHPFQSNTKNYMPGTYFMLIYGGKFKLSRLTLKEWGQICDQYWVYQWTFPTRRSVQEPDWLVYNSGWGFLLPPPKEDIVLMTCFVLSLSARLRKSFWLDLPEKKSDDGWVLVHFRSYYIFRIIWIAVWIQRNLIQIFPFTYHYVPWRSYAFSECSCYNFFVWVILVRSSLLGKCFWSNDLPFWLGQTMLFQSDRKATEAFQ